MKYDSRINELIMWLIFFILIGWLFFGCSASSRETRLEYENTRLVLNSLKIIINKNSTIDSLKTELERCKFNNNLESMR